jgi:hypothetical protein
VLTVDVLLLVKGLSDGLSEWHVTPGPAALSSSCNGMCLFNRLSSPPDCGLQWDRHHVKHITCYPLHS